MHAFAEALADWGNLPGRLVALHSDDGRGRCVVCSAGNQSPRAVFPCRLRSLATEALSVQARRAAGMALPKPHPGPFA